MRLETRNNNKQLLIVFENDDESTIVDSVVGSQVDIDTGLIAKVSGEIRLSDGTIEHYISLSKSPDTNIKIDSKVTLYCLGFIFNENGTQVLLIKKERPDWQAGKLNGIGGHIEPGEDAYEAMTRETKEETGLDIESWKWICKMNGKDWLVNVFAVFTDDVYDYQQMTDETLAMHSINILPTICLWNLRWLIPLCLDVEVSNQKYSVIT